jgi:O-antigen/teichoic acid export membrane protein
MSGSALAEAPAAAPGTPGGRLGRDLSLLSAVKVCTVLLMVGQQALLARALGPAAKGVVDFYLLSLFAVTEFGSLGIASGVVFMVTRRNLPPGVAHGICLRFAAALGAAAAVGLLAYGWLGVAPTYAGAVLAAALMSPAALYLYYWSNLVVATGRPQLAYFSTFAVGGLSMAAIGGVWVAGVMSAATAIMALALSTTAVALVCGGYSFRAWGAGWDRAAAHGTVRFAARMYPAHAANAFHYRLDQFVVGSVLGPAALGVYALAARISEVFWYLDTVVISATLARMTRLPVAESWRLTRRIAAAVLGIGLVGVAAAWLIAPSAIPAVFGAEFAQTGTLLAPLLAGAVAWSLARVVAQFLGFRLERPGLCTAAAAAAAAVNAAAILYLYAFRPDALTLPRVALVSLVSYSVLPALFYAASARLSRRSPADE